jgi:hypothetical protein
MYNFGNYEIAVKYVSDRLGRSISLKTYTRTLKAIESGDFSREWFSDYAVEGYKLEHIKLMSTGYFLRSRILNLLKEESEQKPLLRDKRLEATLQAQLIAVSDMLNELSAGVPIVAEIDARYEAYKREIAELQDRLYRAENKDVLAMVERGRK